MKIIPPAHSLMWVAVLPVLLATLFVGTVPALAQDSPDPQYTLKIILGSIEYEYGRQLVKVDITAVKDRSPYSDLHGGHLIFEDSTRGRVDLLGIDDVVAIEPDTSEALTLLFLLDVSGSMIGDKEVKAKQAVVTAMQYAHLPEQSAIYLATFENVISDNVLIHAGNVEHELNRIEINRRGDTDLFRAIIEKTQALKEIQGTKALIILSDGKNDITNNPLYKDGGLAPYTEQDVYDLLTTVDSSFLIFPIALGEVNIDTVFLQQLPDSTTSPYDVYSFSRTPAQLEGIFYQLVSGLSGNYTVYLYPNYDYAGEERTLRAIWVDDNQNADAKVYAFDQQKYRLGSVTIPISEACTADDFLRLFVIGMLILFVVFAILTLMVPLIKRREFRRKYVVPYRPKSNVVEYDTVTNEPLVDGELVVVKCQMVTPLSVWEGLGNQCPHFPDCMSFLTCNGSGAKETHENFFSQKGMLKKLNWLLFGGIGGFLAWVAFALYDCRLIDFHWHENIVGQLVGMVPFMELTAIQIDNVSDEAFVGVGIGAGLSLALAVVEQLGQSRRFSVLSVVVKTLLGAIFGGLIFFGGALLQSTILPNPYLSGLARWIVFGLSFGMTLSIMSAVSLKRGVIGALLASVIAFHIYYLAFTDILEGLGMINYIRLISLIVLGIILGYTIVTVVTRLEDFEFEFIAPEAYSGRVVPISKWLKQGLEIAIGTSPKCHIFIKWDEHVEEQHALLTFKDDEVFIEPVGETLINGHMLSAKSLTPLKDGAIVQLGRNSVTQMMYKEKRSRPDEPQPVKPDPQEHKRRQYEHKDTRPRINIRRRNS